MDFRLYRLCISNYGRHEQLKYITYVIYML